MASHQVAQEFCGYVFLIVVDLILEKICFSLQYPSYFPCLLIFTIFLFFFKVLAHNGKVSTQPFYSFLKNSLQNIYKQSI